MTTRWARRLIDLALANRRVFEGLRDNPQELRDLLRWMQLASHGVNVREVVLLPTPPSMVMDAPDRDVVDVDEPRTTTRREL